MVDSTLDPTGTAVSAGNDLSAVMSNLQSQSNSLATSTNGFATAMTRAFTQATAGGKQLDTVLQSLALRVSSLAVTQAFKPIASGVTGALTGGLNSLFGGLFSGLGNSGSRALASGGIKPFASGGVVGAPSYFPLATGGLGLAGEAGPEAIVPLSRGSDGRLGIAMSGAGQPANINVQIATPDPGSFRRSEAYVTGQIARAVARGQRSM
jgi:phage-related minor tail protein